MPVKQLFIMRIVKVILKGIIVKTLKILILLLWATSLKAQVTIDTSYTIDSLVRKVLIGSDVIVGKIEYRGKKNAIGHFKFSDSLIKNISEGIILGTGEVHLAKGPNLIGRATRGGYGSDVVYTDKDLNRISKGRTFDVAYLEFDFIPLNDKLSFNFCFGSEEYIEYVGTPFNDVFAFLISGPGIKKNTNLAVVPGTKSIVSVNSINHKENSEYYIDNNKWRYDRSEFQKTWSALFGNKDELLPEWRLKKLNKALLEGLQYDGITTTLKAECKVIPLKKYHIKIAIGDVGDYILDSGIFIKGGSFSSKIDSTKKKPMARLNTSKINFDSIFAYKSPVKPSFEKEVAEIPSEKEFSFVNVEFDFDKTIIPDTSQQHLKDLASYLLSRPTLKLEVLGFTDIKGSKAYNEKLSLQRAQVVTSYLVSKGIHASRLEFKGLNFSRPVSTNETDEGRQRNRRVELLIVEDRNGSKES